MDLVPYLRYLESDISSREYCLIPRGQRQNFAQGIGNHGLVADFIDSADRAWQKGKRIRFRIVQPRPGELSDKCGQIPIEDYASLKQAVRVANRALRIR